MYDYISAVVSAYTNNYYREKVPNAALRNQREFLYYYFSVYYSYLITPRQTKDYCSLKTRDHGVNMSHAEVSG